MYIEDPRITAQRNVIALLDEYRKRTGHGYRYVAHGAKMRETTLCDIRRGLACPGLDTIWKLAQFWQIPVEVFFRR